MTENTVKQVVLDDEQQQAVTLCTTIDTQHRIVSVTGQAGTGKTTILRKAYQTLTDAGYSCSLSAPTGKAAKRITEVTGIPACTNHKLLEYPHPGERDEKTGKPLSTTDPKRDKFNPLNADVIFVDEGAMINHEMYRNLIDAMKPGACIRFFGDVNQLPPIENNKRLQNAPSPFMDVLDRFPSVRLTTIHRQGDGSGIVKNGDLIIRGRMPTRTPDFDYRVSSKPTDTLMETIKNAEEKGVFFNKLSAQIICPIKGGWAGTVKVNSILQNYYMPAGADFLELPRHSWEKDNKVRVAKDDKVIWMQNNYDLDEGNGVFNGETGVVVEVTELGEVEIDFGDRTVVVPPLIETVNKQGNVVTYDPRRDLSLAYAVTTHKSQGSEYEYVIYLMNGSRPFGLNRNNFYTGITRARSGVVVISDQKALTYSMKDANRYVKR
jgi:exodeoxyribonuclease V alpha subunit